MSHRAPSPLRQTRRGAWLQLGLLWDLSIFEGDVPIVGLPAALDGLRIVHVSDAHFGPRWVDAYDRALATIALLNADLIAFTGDWIENKTDFRPGLPTAIRFAAGLRSKFGTFAIVGNHDGDLLAPRLIDAGITVLLGETRRIVGGDASIELIGLPGVHRDDLSDALLDPFAPPTPGTLRIVLGHYPDQVRRVARIRPHLLLAGHTHGGQVCLPGGIPIVKHDSLPRDKVVGLHRIDDVWLHTSRGLGCSRWNVRVWCPPEVTMLTLRAEGKRPLQRVTYNDAVIGFFEERGFDQPWTYGRFVAGPDYRHCALVLERERDSNRTYGELTGSVSEDQREKSHETWMAALESTNQLGLKVDGANVRDFKVDVQGNCEFKLGS